jgi:lambda repressor-like predicted transcriptional regulator
MTFHEKSLELNITAELIKLSDSWHWFLLDIPLWRYWKPKYKLPFIKHPKSTAGAFHITTEGKSDPTGENGGGYDVRIKAGVGKHLLFIQYKKGKLITSSPSKKSIFNDKPIDHFKFQINSKSTNQHFLLRELSNGIGAKQNNAVVYAFPLIEDMDELEKHAGNLLRKTKFVSIQDIDNKAYLSKVEFKKGVEHNFRIGKYDMDRCEVNFFFFLYNGYDYTPDIISDVIGIGFEKNLKNYIRKMESKIREYGLSTEYLNKGIKRSFGEYLRFLAHYFELNPEEINNDLYGQYNNVYYTRNEFKDYISDDRDKIILNKIFSALETFKEFIDKPFINVNNNTNFNELVPNYKPSIFMYNLEGLKFNLNIENSKTAINDISYFKI